MPIRKEAGGIKVMLVTSRETHRWVVPKGWPWADREAHESAAEEAWEEAGVRGRVKSAPLGSFRYDKRRKKDVIPVEVTVFLLEVTEEASNWPERRQRERAWFTPQDAAEAVAETELKRMLRKLAR